MQEKGRERGGGREGVGEGRERVEAGGEILSAEKLLKATVPILYTVSKSQTTPT